MHDLSHFSNYTINTLSCKYNGVRHIKNCLIILGKEALPLQLINSAGNLIAF